MLNIGNDGRSFKSETPIFSGPLSNPRARTQPDAPRVECIEGRTYRSAPVRGCLLPTALVRSTGLLTHMGTPREEWAHLARAVYLQGKADAADSDALRYWNHLTGALETVERIDGTHQKSKLGHAQDIRRRIWKQLPADVDTAEGRRHYHRTVKTLHRAAPYLRDVGPAVEAPDKIRRDTNGRRWTVAPALRDAAPAPPPPGTVRCSGPEPRVDWNGPQIDAMGALERVVAHREQLHERFTEGLAATEGTAPDGTRYFTRHRAVHARRSAQHYARQGSDRAAFVTVGRWRKGEADRADESPACTVPWIVLEIDGRGTDGRKSRTRSVELARRLVRRILTYTGGGAEGLRISYSGGASVHVRLSHRLVGCPVYSSEADAQRALTRLVDGLCSGLPQVRAAVDDSCLRPRQMIRNVGGTHQGGGRCIELAPAELLQADPLTFWGRSEAAPHQPCSLPSPDSYGTYSHALYRLLAHAPDGTGNTSTALTATYCCKVPFGGGRIAPIRGGVSEGRRNDAAYLMALYLLTYGRDPTADPWEALKQWNGRNDPPLSVSELGDVYASAKGSRAVQAAPEGWK